MGKKYQGIASIDTIQEPGPWNAGGCAQYSFFNAGNVNATIDGVLVLEPRQTWKGPEMHPEVDYYSTHRVEFDEANAPTIKTAVGGVEPPSKIINPGDPPPKKDKRVLVFKSIIK